MPRNAMPADWDPPAPAWQSQWAGDTGALVAGYFGIQGDDPGPLQAWAERAFSGEHAPASTEQGFFDDEMGVRNHLYVAYWQQTGYTHWWSRPDVSAWWGSPDRLAGPGGVWREVIAIPLNHLETLHSTEAAHGIGKLAGAMEGPILEHGYPGGMRDRIPLSGIEDLRETLGIDGRVTARAADQHRVALSPPRNMCVIRSGQNWGHCDAAQKRYYLEQIQPVLETGMRFLRDNPRETNCYSMRYVQQTDRDWQPIEETFGLGYATDVYGFENWAKSHPTHVAIFDSFMEMVGQFGEQLALRLWHEVSVLPGQGSEFEYIGCHGRTGLLKYS